METATPKCSFANNSERTSTSTILNIKISFKLIFLLGILLFSSNLWCLTNYTTSTGNLGTTYSWIDCSPGTTIVSGDDVVGSFAWPFDFKYYGTSYTTSDDLSVCTNGFIRLDGDASTDYSTASAFTLSSASTELGQIIAAAVYDGNVSSGSTVKYLVTGSSPNRILTVEYNNLEIDYNDGLYATVQVSFYETTNNVVLKLGADDITTPGVDMGIHSGVAGYCNKWQEVASGANDTWIEYTPSTDTTPVGAAASWNYGVTTGTLGTTYSWVNCDAGTSIVTGDDAVAAVSWPFDFYIYDNAYTTSDVLSVTTNGYIRFDGTANTNYSAASSYTLSSSSTELGQIIAAGIYDAKLGGISTSWCKYLVTGTAPSRIFTIEYSDLEIDYNDTKYTDVQISFYENTKKIVLKFGADNIDKTGAYLGIHSGIDGYFNNWKEVLTGTNNTWIEYTPAYIEVNATQGTATAYYSTLKDAFDKINSGLHQGDITVKVKHNTTESVAAVLYQSGKGSSNYTSVNIFPTATNVTISGNLPTPLIDFNGADNVTLDGRVNASGTTRSLSLINNSTSSASGTSTIRFLNDASNNTVKYCKIKGSETRSASGIIYFATTTATTGNDNNTISNNNISSAADDYRPVNGIFSSGTTGKENDGIIISGNNIFDFIKHTSSSNGVYLSSNTTSCTVDGNSFYETTTFIPRGSIAFSAIQINNTKGSNYTIANNYIGGSQPLCGGAAWTKTSANNNVFNGIKINALATSTSSIQNNTIKNFNWSNSGSGSWYGIYVMLGNVNIGTITGNNIGESTGNGSIELTNTSATNTGISYGIYNTSSGTVYVSNNNIGSITTFSSGSVSNSFMGIYKNTSILGDFYVLNNLIGSKTTANSIQAATSSTSSNSQNIYGIRSNAIGNTWITNNVVANLSNNYAYATASSGQVVGIFAYRGTNVIQNDTIFNLSTTSPSSDALSNASVIGIAQASTTAIQTTTGNVIYNLSNTYTGTRTSNIIGIYNAGGTTGVSTISGNFIHSFSLTSTAPSTTPAALFGIKIYSGLNTTYNNIVTLGTGITTGYGIYGIYETGGANNNNNIYFNTVYLGGDVSDATATAYTYALYSSTNNNTRDIRNNILYNARSGGTTGKHYAIRVGGITNLTIDYNDYYYAPNTSAGVGRYVSADKTTLALWQASTLQDTHSLNIIPTFIVPGGTSFENYKASATLPAVFGTGILTDFEDITRTNPPRMGALESTVDFIWQGNTSNNYGTASNWQNGIVPPDGTYIKFADTPANDCYLNQNRTIKTLTNTSAKKLYINGNQLTITGSILSTTANQIDATATNSHIVFAGTAAQSIPTGVFVNNSIDAITVNNSNGLTQNGNITVSSALTLTSGAYKIGSNTLTINGAINSTSGALTGGATTNIIIGGSGASTNLPALIVNDFTLNRSNGIGLSGNLSIGNALTLTAGTLVTGANTLTLLGSTLNVTSGSIDASDGNSTLAFSNATAIVLPSSTFTNNINNLTVNGKGLTASSDISVNGVLNLQSANPSLTKGSLDMGSYTLNMGVNATTSGIGDVAGIVKREHSFSTNTAYTFGNTYTNFTFTDGNTVPTWLSVKIDLGAVPTWAAWSPNGKVKRLYKVACSDNSSTAQAIVNMHYLVSELDATYNDQTKLTVWHTLSTYKSGDPHEHGTSEKNSVNHYLQVSGIIVGTNCTTNLDDSQFAIAYSSTAKNTWKGEVVGHETEWNIAQNWTEGKVPLSTDNVLIPGGLAHYPSLTVTSGAVAKTLEIAIGAALDMNAFSMTIYGAGGAWDNMGTFNAGTGKVIFNHGVLSEIVTIAGTTDFYNIEVGPNTAMQPSTGCILRIAGIGMADETSQVDFSQINNTVEWNGSNQTIVNPQGIGGSSGYYNLILSGTGIKTMPASNMTIAKRLTISDTATATAASELSIAGALVIDEGATFATGNYNHSIGGHFDNSGTFTAASGATITMNGTSNQYIYGASQTAFNNLTINNPAGVTMQINTTINNTFSLLTGDFNIGDFVIYINGNTTRVNGTLTTSAESSIVFGGTTAINLPTNLFSTTPEIKALTINNVGGVVFNNDITVNDNLVLQSNNPASGTIGTLDMGSKTLIMGEDAITTGAGDATGIVKRISIIANKEYTLGNKYTSINFLNVGTLPTEIALKTTIGTAPTWKSDAVKRAYDLTQVGAADSRAEFKAHYLDTELNGNVEESLIDLTYIYPTTELFENGSSNVNTTENWVSLANANIANLQSTFGIIEVSLGTPITDILTWKGSTDTDWNNSINWNPTALPSASKKIVIPNASTTLNDPILPASAEVNAISIQSGGILNAASNSTLTINGYGGAWICNGTFNASTSKVLFNNGNTSNVVTIAGTTDFYDIEVAASTTLQPTSGTILRIAGSGIADVTSIVDFSKVNNTVEWNGANQTIAYPNGIGGQSGYYNLTLSGSGIKILPSVTFDVAGDFTTLGTASVNANASVNVTGNVTLGTGTILNTGSYNHTTKGNLENNGTFNANASNLITFNGSTAQTISGTSALEFEKIEIDNLAGVTLTSPANVNSEIILTDGDFIVGETTLGINGSLSRTAGNIEVSEISSIVFGGTDPVALINPSIPITRSIKNLTINRTGGVYFTNQHIKIFGTLNLVAGTLNIGASNLTFLGNSPTCTSGNVDLTTGTVIFRNPTAITLAANMFKTGIVNNFTIAEAGGVTAAEDLTIAAVLDLQSANPSSTKGILDMGSYTLNMGVNSTTTGIGDITGIVKREHIFSNDVEYSFGNKFTTMKFLGVDGSTKPTWISCKIDLGIAPIWRMTNVERKYSFLQAGGNDRTYVKLHYLDSELNDSETDEDKIIMYTDKDGLATGENTVSLGTTSNNTTDNWIQLLGMAINQIATSSTTYAKEYGLGYSDVSKITWTGLGSSSYPGDWNLPGNWLGGVPTSEDDVLIPAGLSTTYPNNNLLSSFTTCEAKTIEIEPGATLDASTFDISIAGNTKAWVNNGTFISGNKTVTFFHGDLDSIVTVTGNTNFHNLIISDKVRLQPAANSLIGVSGSITAAADAILDFAANENTIDYNGTDQTIVNPNGTTPDYYHLSLSGSGIKTLPITNLDVLGNMNFSGTSSATTQNDIHIGGNITLNETPMLTISTGNSVEVNGNVNNNVGVSALRLKSAAAVANGSLIFHNSSNNPLATVEMYSKAAASTVVGSTYSNYKWQFIGVPIQSVVANPTFSEYVGAINNGSYINKQNEPGTVALGNYWVAQGNSSVLTPFTGYEITQKLEKKILFSGQLVNNDFQETLTYTPSAKYPGQHIYGNSYTAAINIGDIIFGSDMDSTVYLYNTGSYADWETQTGVDETAGQYIAVPFKTAGIGGIPSQIPSMQGFLVKALRSSANATIEIPYSSVVVKNTDRQRVKAAKSTVTYTKVVVKGKRFSDKMWLFTNSTCTRDWDNGWDGDKIFGSSLTPQIWANETSGNYQIDALDNVDNTVLKFRKGEDTNYTLTFTHENIEMQYPVLYLEDLTEGTFTDITQSGSTYSFTTDDSTTPVNRFKIVTSPGVTTNLDAAVDQDITIYNVGTTIYVNNRTDKSGTLNLFDGAGRVLILLQYDAKTVTAIPTELLSGMYIIKGNTIDNKSVSKSVIIN